MERVEVSPKIQIDQGEEKRLVLFCGQRASSFIKDVVSGKTVDGKKYRFDAEFVMEIHDRVSLAPGVKGLLRQTDSTTVGGEPVIGSYEQLLFKMSLFGRWLQEQIGELKENPEDLLLVIKIAAAAHYGLVQRQFHPFDNGNGRTARALMNAILMSQSYELTAHGLAIPPIPIVRTDKDEGHYIRCLRAVDKTRVLNPLMSFIAQKWLESLEERMQKIKTQIKKPKTKADQLLFAKLESRQQLLRDFLKTDFNNGESKQNGNGNYKVYPVPDYFALKYIKVSNA